MVLRICLGCGTPTPHPRCPPCAKVEQRRRDQARGTPQQRGLGWAHRRERNALVAAAALTHCPRCDAEITQHNPITAEHGVARAHGGTQITELMCRRCNSSLGAQIRRTD
jgi:HNH endonuclease